MSNPVIDSLLFLSHARNTIVEAIDMSHIEEAEELKVYITNEASDYEVMHLLVFNEMPETKFDNDDEQYVWECFRRSINRSYSDISEAIGSDILESIIFEMGPVIDYGLSSAKPILEFHSSQGLFSEGKKERAAKRAATEKRNAELRAKSKGKISYPGQDKNRASYVAPFQSKDNAAIALKNKKNKEAWAKNIADRKASTEEKAKRRKQLTQGGAALAVAAAISFGAYKLYKKYKANKPKALKAQISALKSGMSSCGKSKEPAKCKAVVQAKVKKLQARLAKA